MATRFRTPAAIALLTLLLAGCGGHSTSRTGTAGGARTAAVTATPSAAAGPLTVANVYDRVVAGASYRGLRGTMTLKETTAEGTLDLNGPFATNLDPSRPTSDLQLASGTKGGFSVRAIGTELYCKLGPEPWKDYTVSGPTENTAAGEQIRAIAAQLLGGLDPQEIIGLLQVGHNLAAAPAPAGDYAFTATTGIGGHALVYDPHLNDSYQAAGITTVAYTAIFDQQARPTALTEHLASSKLTIDYHLSITGYSAAKVSAPI